MPEGDTIRKVAAALEPALLGQRLVAAECRYDGVVTGLSGRIVEALRPRGKHLLIEIDDGSAVHVHLGMKGSWHGYEPGERWQMSRDAMGLVLVTADRELVCFFPPTVERLRLDALHLHPALGRLGPDLLDEAPDFERMVTGAMAEPERAFEEVLLDQRIACGIGNVYKCELLLMAGLHPRRAIGSVSSEQIGDVYRNAATLMAANLGPGKRNTRGGALPRHWVYKRPACVRCGERVAVTTAKAARPRTTWWCPSCQS